MSHTDSLQKDIVTLNRRFLLVVQQMANAKHPLLTHCAPGWLMQKVRNMTLEEIDDLAEDMIAPCFHLNLHEGHFEQMKEIPQGDRRKAYMANVVASRPAFHA